MVNTRTQKTFTSLIVVVVVVVVVVNCCFVVLKWNNSNLNEREN
jgi:amino acid permease